MEEYKDWSYKELRAECAKRELGGKGSADALIEKLVNDDLGHEPEKTEKPDKSKYAGLKATDPNPDNPNYDMAGRWIRRNPKEWRGK